MYDGMMECDQWNVVSGGWVGKSRESMSVMLAWRVCLSC